MSNRELKWETTEQYNVGLDLGLLDNRLNMTLDLYYKNTKDLLQQISIPPSTGFSSMWINRGNIENRGVEFSVDAYPVDNADFTWNVNANISFNRNKIGSIGLPAASHGNIFASAFEGEEISNTSDYFKMPANIFIEGRPAGLFYGFRTNGIVTQEAIDKGLVPTYRGQQLQPGDIWYLDTDGSGNVDDMDKEVIGDPNPSFTYGFSTSFRWKSLSLSMMFDGVYGNQIANGQPAARNEHVADGQQPAQRPHRSLSRRVEREQSGRPLSPSEPHGRPDQGLHGPDSRKRQLHASFGRHAQLPVQLQAHERRQEPRPELHRPQRLHMELVQRLGPRSEQLHQQCPQSRRGLELVPVVEGLCLRHHDDLLTVSRIKRNKP